VSEALGPFEVTGPEVAALGDRFSQFVNLLLEQETATVNMSGHLLRTNYKENIPDGGVDAGLEGSPGTRWLPVGDSAWQFKRVDLAPADCKTELSGAEWVKERVKEGARYRLALGAALTDKKLAKRLKALREQAVVDGLPDDGATFAVLDANMLARWATQHPAIALSPLFRGMGPLVMGFDAWSRSIAHRSSWTADPDRQVQLTAIRSAISDPAVKDLRVEGDSGVGKTRLVMEALRGSEFSSLVVYLQQAHDPNPYTVHLLTSGRSVILVADECGRRRHDKLRELITHDAPVTLISIGQADSTPLLPSGVISLEGMPDEDLEAVLQADHPALWPEARRFVVRHTAGNVKMAILAATALERGDQPTAIEVVRSNDWDALLGTVLPDGEGFFAAAVLSLFSRLGWDDDAAYQAEELARLTGVSLEGLRSAAADLERAGLMVRQGRYRAVAPHPAAVFLAERAWREREDLLTDSLFPNLDAGMATAFLTRAADIGDFGPTRAAAARWLGNMPQFVSIAALEEHGAAHLLTQIAIIAPDEALDRVASWLSESSDEELIQQGRVRRDLVWTLEKLVWHSRLFERAADALLLLALSENESFSNNATGTWASLFSGPLPNTAASPDQRLRYLSSVLAREPDNVALLGIVGATKALSVHGSVMVSGEVQGGRLVEPRGGVRSWEEAWGYQSRVVEELARRLGDPRDAIVSAAQEALRGAIHGSLETPVLDAIVAAVPLLNDAGLRGFRQELAHLGALYRRVPDHPGRVDGLARLEAVLPPEDAAGQLQVMLQLQRWDFDDSQFQGMVTQGYRALGGPDQRLEQVPHLLSSPIKAGYELGYAVGMDADLGSPVVDALTQTASTDLSPLTGFLAANVDRGLPDAFNLYLSGAAGSGLPAQTRIALAVRGPRDAEALRRVMEEVKTLAPAGGAVALFGWHRALPQSDVASLVVDWLSRIGNQWDYNRVVDFVAMTLYQVESLEPSLAAEVRQLVEMRRMFPDLGPEAWDWAVLARYFLQDEPVGVATLLFDLAASGQTYLFGGDEDAALIREAVALEPGAVWAALAAHLEGGSWRLQLDVRTWLVPVFPSDVVVEWVGSDLARARQVADLVRPAGAEPNPVVHYLLDHFDDDEVGRNLYGGLISGTWSGPESDRIAGQVAQIEQWRDMSSPGVRRWAARALAWLQESRERALQWEAEEFG
jgi:hypothetical protein